MKTVNKILLTALGILFIAIIAVFITLRIELAREAHKGSGRIVTEERILTNFNEIEARGNLVIYIKQSDNYKVMIEADDNLIEFVETNVSRGRLRIRLSEPVNSTEEIRLYVELSDLNFLEGASGSYYISDGVLDGTVLTKELNSGARSTLSLFYDELNLTLKSGAVSNLLGTVNDFSVEGSSGAILNARELTSKNCEAKTSSGAEITVYVLERFNANASSGGVIRYHGNPTDKSWNTSSGGQIVQK